MRTTTFVTATSAFAALATAHPSTGRYSSSSPSRLAKRAGNIAINGVAGSTQPRLEIRQLQATQPEQWSLFIQAMQQWQTASQDDETGYYQVTGIHGVPRQNWDGVEPCDGCGNADGYCTHDSVLFPAWHRAYVALFEQELVAVAQQIASTYPDSTRAAMQAAASTLRMPYWDWAADPGSGPVLPDTVSQPQITINGTQGQEAIKNPLYSYAFSSTSALVYSPFVTWPETLRYPNTNAVSATSQENQAVSAFANFQPNLQEQIYQLMSTCGDYLSFSNDDAGTSSTQCANSLESIHNTVHGLCGGPAGSSVSAGHMTYLAEAGFDPIFWLHHANVDRYFALWQNQHPNSYGASQVAPHNTWTIEQGSTQDANSPLTPFHKDSNGDFWTTNDVRDYESTFHYTYPEFVSTEGSQDAIASLINGLYGPSATLTAGGVPVSTKSAMSSSSSSMSSTVSSSSSMSSSSPSSSSAATTSSTSGKLSSSTGSGSSSSSSSKQSSSTASTTASPSNSGSSTGSTSMSSSMPVISSSSSSSSSASKQTSSAGSSTQSLTSSGSSTGSMSTSSSRSSSGLSSASSIHYMNQTTTAQRSSSGGKTTVTLSTSSSTSPSSSSSTAEPSQYVDKSNDGTYQYVANCETSRYSLNGSYFIFGFNGAPASDDTTTWFSDKNSVGVISVIAGGGMKNSLLTTGSIPLTRMLQRLVNQGVLKNMSEDECLPYLSQHFNWRIIGPDGGEIKPQDVPGFKLSVHSATSSQPAKDQLPQWNQWKPHPKVTEGKAGGANAGDAAVNYPAPAAQASSSASASAGSSAPQQSSGSGAAPQYTQGGEVDEPVTVTVMQTFTETVCACKPTMTY